MVVDENRPSLLVPPHQSTPQQYLPASVVPKSQTQGIGAWAVFRTGMRWSVIGAGVLLSPLLAFLLALAVAVLVAEIKEAGLPAFLAIVGVCVIVYHFPAREHSHRPSALRCASRMPRSRAPLGSQSRDVCPLGGFRL